MGAQSVSNLSFLGLMDDSAAIERVAPLLNDWKLSVVTTGLPLDNEKTGSGT